MPLDARGFQITPDILGAASRGLQVGQQFRQVGREREARERQEQIRRLLGDVGQAAPQTEQEAMLGAQTAELAPISQQAAMEQPQILSQDELISQAQQIDPIFANKQLTALGLDEPSKRAEASRFAAEVQSLPLEQQNQRIQERAQTLQAQGRNPSDTLELLQMEPAQRVQALQGVQLLDLSTKERFGVREKIAKRTGEIEEVSEVQRAVILDDGTVQIVRKDGTVEIKQPSVLDKEIVRRGQERGVDLQQRRAQGRELGKGTVVNIYLPLVTSIKNEQLLQERVIVKANDELILVADDDNELHQVIRSVLLSLGYRVITAVNGEDAFRLYEKHKDEIALALLDIVMPKMNGIDLATRIRQLNSNVAIIFTTGYNKEETLKAQQQVEKSIVLNKPFLAEQLSEAISQLLD